MQRFNRHEIFEAGDTRLVMDLISDTENFQEINMLYGLFDGYLYPEIKNLPGLESIINKINQGS